MSELSRVINDLRKRVSDLERRGRDRGRTGTIAEVNAGAGLVRVNLQDGEGGAPFLTGWIPWAEAGAGSMKTHMPPSVGQQVQISSESGDLTDAVVLGSLNSGSHGRPSGAGDAYVLANVGAASITISGGGAKMVLAVGASEISITEAEISVTTGGNVVINAAGNVDIDGAKIDLN